MSSPGGLKNDRLLRALNRHPVDRVPVWIMRQAGRYLPEYRETRGRAGDFLTLCKTPELACEVTLQPLARFPLDAAIVFSDILTIPDAMGLGLSLEEGVGPRFARPIRTSTDIENLGVPDPESDLGYVCDAIRLIKSELDNTVPLIGFCGSPWTLATYMVEGRSGSDFRLVKEMLYGAPEALHQLLSTVSKASVSYLNAQLKAGADTVMIFDTWGGILGHREYLEFSLAYMNSIVRELGPQVPIILFTKGGGQWLTEMASTGCQGLGLDWTTDLGSARQLVGDRVALQGNLDPAVLRAPPDVVAQKTADVIHQFGAHPGHIFNLGHGITPDINPDHLGIAIETAQNVSQSLHFNS